MFNDADDAHRAAVKARQERQNAASDAVTAYNKAERRLSDVAAERTARIKELDAGREPNTALNRGVDYLLENPPMLRV